MSEPSRDDSSIELVIDFDALTIGEIDEIEDRTGMAFAEITRAFTVGDRPVGKLLRALALVQLRRRDPNATWEDTADVRLPSGPVGGAEVDPPSPPSVSSD